MKRTLTSIVIIALVLGIVSSCQQEKVVQTENNDYLLMATLFHQQAAEKRALSYQAYNTAKLMLDKALKSARLTKKLAVVVDIDETVLDNSQFEAKSIIENTDYPRYWKEWCNEASARPISGSLEFLNYAKSQGVDVFYITNRKLEFKDVTIKNLVMHGFPDADEAHLLMKTDISNKEPRREIVEKTHHIVLLVGDNLGDFLHDFDDITNERRFALTDSLKNEFGSRFIMLPNPMYGGWVGELLNNNFDLTKEEKIRLFKENLISF